MRTLLDGLGRALLEAALVTLCVSGLAVAINALRADGIPLVAREAYEILVPCPEPGGQVSPLPPADPVLGAAESFVIDARAAAEHGAWAFRRARSVPYDYLDPTPPETLRALAAEIARSRARRVVVYGDGDRPDTGEQLAREIAGFGIKNVCFVEGGAPALRAATSAPGGTP